MKLRAPSFDFLRAATLDGQMKTKSTRREEYADDHQRNNGRRIIVGEGVSPGETPPPTPEGEHNRSGNPKNRHRGTDDKTYSG